MDFRYSIDETVGERDIHHEFEITDAELKEVREILETIKEIFYKDIVTKSDTIYYPWNPPYMGTGSSTFPKTMDNRIYGKKEGSTDHSGTLVKDRDINWESCQTICQGKSD